MTVLDDAKNKQADAKRKLNDIERGIADVGFGLLGIAAPFLALRWTATEDGTAPTEAPALLGLQEEDEWVAPAPGILALDGGADRIVFADGGFAGKTDKIGVFRLHAQAHLRLLRLYAGFLENRTDDRAVRQVPYWFVYRGSNKADSAASGPKEVAEPLGLSGGTLSIHDRRGLPIDPVAVACAFDALLTAFPTLEKRPGLGDAPTPAAQRQINQISKLGAAGTKPVVRLRIADPHGQPLKDASALQNLTPVAAPAGIYTPSGTAAIGKAANAPADLRFGLATYGTLSTSFTPPPNPRNLLRDFISLVAVDLKPYLTGERPATDPAAPFEARPEVRHQEAVTLSLDGAAALGGANQLLSGTPADAFVVSPVIRNDFLLPDDGTDAKAHWPNFPPPASTNTAPIPNAQLRANLKPEAHYIKAAGPGADVLLTLHGLQPGQAVRVYNRVFLPDAREGRGDGAGGVVTDAGGSLALLLRDPLGLVARGDTNPTNQVADATLHLDVVVANAAGKARVFGNVVAPVGTAQPAPAPPAVSNRFGMAGADRGISPAGILGLPARPLPQGTNVVALALALAGEGNPREAPRLPTMARREAVVAADTVSGTTRTWKAQLSGAHLVPGTLNAAHRTGSPGSPGGPEFQTVAVSTSGGLLAHDLARAALRRTRHLLPRLVALHDARWVPPTAATAGSVSAALLQTVAPVAETPELGPLESEKQWLTNLPVDWPGVVDKVLPDLPDSLPDVLKTALQKLVNDLKNSPASARMHEEFKRDFCATVHGRRDAFWAVRHALPLARELIYLEGPSFTATDYADGAGSIAGDDLVGLIAARMAAAPGLRVALALSKELDYGPGYETFAAREYARRLEAVGKLKAVDANRVVAFHPIGFPGRPLRLTTPVLVVDDLWAMVGASTFRRRGMAFDGGLDLAVFDTQIREGGSVAIADLRRRLMAGHLNVGPPAAGAVPHPTWVQLADVHSAFAACKGLLDHGGAGLIEPIWNGQVPGRPVSGPFPLDSVADPDGRSFNSLVAAILAALSPAGQPPVLP